MPAAGVVAYIGGARRVTDAEARHRFGSLSDLVAYVRRLPVVPGADECREWAGGTLADAYQLATTGWPEGAAHARAVAPGVVRTMVGTTAFSPEIADLTPSIHGALDLGAYLAGVPECCMTLAPATDRPTCRMLVGIGASGQIGPDALRRRAVAIAAIVWALETAGYAASVTVTDSASKSDALKTSALVACTTSVEVMVHQASGALDLDAVVFACGHPAMLRRLCRAVPEGRAGVTGSTPEWGQLYPHPGYCPDEYDVVFPGLLGSTPSVFGTDKQAAEWAQRWARRIAQRQYGELVVVSYS